MYRVLRMFHWITDGAAGPPRAAVEPGLRPRCGGSLCNKHQQNQTFVKFAMSREGAVNLAHWYTPHHISPTTTIPNIPSYFLKARKVSCWKSVGLVPCLPTTSTETKKIENSVLGRWIIPCKINKKRQNND